MSYLIADSALYSEANLQQLAEVKGLTRVPERIAPAKALVERVTAKEMQPAAQEGYRYTEWCTTSGGVRQRWLVVWSAQEEKRERATLQKRIGKERQAAEKGWRVLRRRGFPSREAAEEAVMAWAKRRTFHGVKVPYQAVAHSGRKGRPVLGEAPQRVGWRGQGKVVEQPEAIAEALKGLGKFVLATDELDEERLPAEEMREAYKGQGVGPERGFRFLVEPQAHTSSNPPPPRPQCGKMLPGHQLGVECRV